ncbi:MAG: ABC transporter ATP-binding protein [Candidatus Marinimicrobia bacterium]|nr:ABC transporter ATP-binding protein [Candidatus Neomarinimicrobiota bacterium]
MNCEIKIKNLNVRLNDRDLPIIKDLSLKIKSGYITTLLGKSGSGKTTLCHAIARLLDKRYKIKGNINFNCNGNFVNLLLLDEKEISRIGGSHISISFQEPSRFLNPVLRCGDHLKDLVDYRNNEWVEFLFDKFGFKNHNEILKKYPYELSGGQAQKFSLILALSRRPKFLIADEPTTGIDYADKKIIGNTFRELVLNENTGIFMVTHDISFAFRYSDYISIIEDGLIIVSGKKEYVLNSTDNLYISKLLSLINPDNVY